MSIPKGKTTKAAPKGRIDAAVKFAAQSPTKGKASKAPGQDAKLFVAVPLPLYERLEDAILSEQRRARKDGGDRPTKATITSAALTTWLDTNGY